MATEWYIQAFREGEEQFIYIENILKIFPEYKIEKEYGCVIVKLSNSFIDFYIDFTDKQTSGITVSRPDKDVELINIIYKIMELGNFVFYTADGLYPIVLREIVEKELPKDMIEALGKPKLAINKISFMDLVNKLYE